MKLSIKKAVELFNITTNKLRFYEKKGLLTAKRDEENNYRYYNEEDLVKIQGILMYRVLGFSIEDIQKLMNEKLEEGYLDFFYNQWNMINDQMHCLRTLQNSLETMMDQLYEGEDIYESVLVGAKEVQRIGELKDGWIDKWDFDHWSKTYDDAVVSDYGELGLYRHYDEILDEVVHQTTKHFNLHNKDVIPEDLNILDIGVGTGNLSKRFLEKGFKVIGIDQSREMLNVAKKKIPDFKVRLGEFLKIPFEQHQFDSIITTYAFHHLNEEEKELALDEMIRVLKKEGIIVIGDMMFEDDKQKEELFATLSKGELEEIEDEFYTNIKWLEECLQKKGKELTYKKMDRLNYVVTISDKC